MNFPLVHYLDVTGQQPHPVREYREGVKWVNLYSDLESFRDSSGEAARSLTDWFRSLRGPRVYSDYAWDDPLPRLYQSAFGYALPTAWSFLSRPRAKRHRRPRVL